jgi:O-antigen biosynthesis protein
VHLLSDRKRWLVGRARRLEPKAVGDVERLADGSWQVRGLTARIALVPEDGGDLPTGDVRIGLSISGVESPFHASLVLDNGAGFARGLQVPLPEARLGRIAAVVTLPPSTVAIGFDPGRLGNFRFASLRLTELSVLGAVWSHGVPQLRRLMRNPAQFAVLLARAARLLRYRGPRGIVERLRRETKRHLSDEGYQGWAKRYATVSEKQRQELRARDASLDGHPTFSVLLDAVGATEPSLRRTLHALAAQLYPRWELCLSEDEVSGEVRELVERTVPRERVRWVSGGDTLAGARGEFITRLKPGDAFAENALFAVAETVAQNPKLALVYTDADAEDGKGGLTPAFKPEWSPELLRSQDYVGRAAFFRTEALRAVGGWRSRPGDVAQHELLFRYTANLPPEQIAHLAVVLVHSRPEPLPNSEEALQGLRAVQTSLDQAGAGARVEPGRRPGTYRVRYALPNPSPLVTVVIPTRDRLALLTRCIKSVQELTAYQPLEILVIDNDSRKPETRAYLQALEGQGASRVLRYPHPFNFSAMNNLAARDARGELLCLLNNDVEAFDAGWLTEMVGLALQPGVGAVGAKLLYPDSTVQHAGIVAGLFGVAAHGYLREPRQADGYLFQLQTTREVSAVTAACLVVRRDTFLEVGGFDETHLAVAFNDVDFCFKLLRAGYRNLWTPYAELYHRESASRGNDEQRADRQRYLREESVMRERWGELIERDPYYSPNLSLDSNTPRPAWPPRVVGPTFVAR